MNKNFPLEARVFKAARELFHEKGYYSTTTREIAQRAGTSETGVFRKFASKYDLLMAVYNEAWRSVNEAINETAVGEDPRKEIIRIFHTLAHLYENDSLTMEFILINTGNTDTLLVERKPDAIISDENQKYISRLRALCEKAIDRHLVGSAYTTNSLTEIILGVFEGTLLGWYLADHSNSYINRVTVQEMIDALQQILSIENSELSTVPTAIVDYLPASPSRTHALISRIVSSSTSTLVEQIAELRDYAECERYRKKSEVDDYLLNSPQTTRVCQHIETLFKQGDLAQAARHYLALLKEDLGRLHDIHIQAIFSCERYSLADWKSLWSEIAPLADIDNAHAMYLSSDNWPFSVFHKIISEFEMLVPSDDAGALGTILTAGVQDARTYVYQNLGGIMTGATRVEFVKSLLESNNLILPNGIMPMFAFQAATKPPTSGNGLKSEQKLTQEFNLVADRVWHRLPSKDAARFASLVDVYKRLYTARAAYDIYEYFGFYAFVRHFLIIKCAATIALNDLPRAEAFKRTAATYQFGRALEIMNSI